MVPVKVLLSKFVRNYKTTKGPIGFGYYINADDIAVALRTGPFNFGPFDITVTAKEFNRIVLSSGLINDQFTKG